MFKSIINLSYVFILVYPLSLSHIIAQEYSLGFDGQNDYVRIPDHEDFDFTENYTLEAWIFPETFSWLAGIISKYQTNAANGYMLRLTSQSPYTGVGFDELVSSNGVFVANQWYHIAAVNNRGDRGERFRNVSGTFFLRISMIFTDFCGSNERIHQNPSRTI